ncbi:MAG: hypothetical protein H7138_22305, partial [Myxococcales bacterium]|nr:hypothetical protein [Myxococcales bacterium]
AKQAKPAAAAADDEPTIIEDEPDPPPPPAVAPPPGQALSGGKLVKQDLLGHDLGPAKQANVFERDLFFVDKTDTAETEKGTLVQGSLTSTTFGYHEEGGTLATNMEEVKVPSASPYNRLFTDLRLQTDFRHISAGRWDARIDVRGRLVNSVEVTSRQVSPLRTDPSIQSGLLGEQELDIKELWIVRNGRRSDVFFGRQFVADLGGVRIDGLRIDYASSEKITLLGFGGLYPIRGSRSITNDYTPLRSDPDDDGTRTDAGRFTGAGGIGAAYRTANTYGSFGGVVLAPLTSAEGPRIYVTSTGYAHVGSKLDFYHLALIDVVGSNAVNAGLTNLSLGLNWKPDQRLRGTLAFHRVDTETLNVQAQAFLNDPSPDVDIIDNEAFIQRIATNQARASLSAGLGELQRFELTAALAFRYRDEVTLTSSLADAGTDVLLPAAQSVEVYGAITDRRSFAKLRLGIDGSQVFGIGDNTYQRTTSTTVRAFLGREIANGRGEWELEGTFNLNEDDGAGVNCGSDLLTCFGATKSTVLSAGGNLFFRLSRSWLVNASAFVNHLAITERTMTATVVDPPVFGMNGFLRIAFRF